MKLFASGTATCLFSFNKDFWAHESLIFKQWNTKRRKLDSTMGKGDIYYKAGTLQVWEESWTFACRKDLIHVILLGLELARFVGKTRREKKCYKWKRERERGNYEQNLWHECKVTHIPEVFHLSTIKKSSMWKQKNQEVTTQYAITETGVPLLSPEFWL